MKGSSSNDGFQKRLLQGFVSGSLKSAKQQDQVQLLTKEHYNKAIEYYKDFEEDLLKNIQVDLKDIQNALNVQLGRTIRKLQNKLRGPYSSSISESIRNFYLEPYITKQVQDVYKSLGKLKQKIYQYINQFCNNVLSRNIQKNNQLSLYHYSNQIRSLDKNWNSVSSRSPVNRAQISVKGFNRPQTTWLALGVTKKMKEFGPIKSSFNKQDFMGNIYLNGSDQMTGYKLKRDLNNNDIFIIEIQNRMVWVYRKSEGRSKKQVFIMDDNVQYFVYIGIKGPIQLKFWAQ